MKNMKKRSEEVNNSSQNSSDRQQSIHPHRNSAVPSFQLDKSYEEDAVFAAHTDDYWIQNDRMMDKLLEDTFSDSQNYDLPGEENLYDPDNEDFRWTIGLSPELLRIYIASGITLLTEEAIRRGIPRERVMEIRRRAFVALSEEKDTGRWSQISESVTQNLHQEYLALKAGSVSSHPVVRKACIYIYLHRLEPVSAGNVADYLKVDRTYLARLFQSDLHTTISNQILSVKMEQAAEWIRSGRYTLQEIAANLSFSSYAYFSKRFKEYYGISPRDFSARQRS